MDHFDIVLLQFTNERQYHNKYPNNWLATVIEWITLRYTYLDIAEITRHTEERD